MQSMKLGFIETKGVIYENLWKTLSRRERSGKVFSELNLINCSIRVMTQKLILGKSSRKKKGKFLSNETFLDIFEAHVFISPPNWNSWSIKLSEKRKTKEGRANNFFILIYFSFSISYVNTISWERDQKMIKKYREIKKNWYMKNENCFDKKRKILSQWFIILGAVRMKCQNDGALCQSLTFHLS